MQLGNSKRLGGYLPYDFYPKPEGAVEKLVSDSKRYGVDFDKWDFFDVN